MRRLLAALLASVMIVGAADARVAVIAPIDASGGAITAEAKPEVTTFQNRDMRMLNNVLNSLGARGNYVIIPQANWKTEWARTGLFVWPNGTTEQFDGIIIPNYPGSARVGSGAIYPSIALDSLTRVSRGGVLVPHLYLLTNAVPSRALDNGYLSSSSAAVRCSVGVVATTQKTNALYGQVYYMTERPTVRWFPHTYTAGWELGMTVPGGIRKLLQMGSNNFTYLHSGGWSINAQWADSLRDYPSATDSVVVWDRLWANIASCPGAKTMTFADYYGAGAPSDSLANAGVVGYRNVENEGDLSVLNFALAHFDSLIGGRLFTNGPATRGIVVSGAASRGLRRWTGGIAPSDTTAFYSSLDSLASWGLPITFALNVNPDTLTTYARDLIKLKSVPQARFTPYITDGVFDTTSTTIGAGASAGLARNKARWVDVFGRWRDRTLVGDFGAFSDTSLATQLAFLRTFTDSVTGRPTVRVLVPPYDDWSPGVKSATNRFRAKENSRLYADSTMYAMQRAGFIGVLANGQSPECDLSVSGGVGYTNPRGFIGRQGWYVPKLPGSVVTASGISTFVAGAYSDPFMVLTHAGSTMGLGKTQEVLFDDSTSAKSQGSMGYLAHTIERAHGGFWTAVWTNKDEWGGYYTAFNVAQDWYTKPWAGVVLPYDDMLYPPKRSYVLKLFCSDLSGDSANPARGGLIAIRSIQQSFNAVNYAAGRTLVRLGYLDEVRP